MAAERPLLKEENVRAAERREGEYAHHPIVLALDRNAEGIKRFVDGYFSVILKDPQAHEVQDDYLRDSAGFLVNVIASARPYTLTSLEMIGVWSRVLEIFPDSLKNQGVYHYCHHRYMLAEIISGTFAVQPGILLETMQLPEDILKDKPRTEEILDRLEIIKSNSDDIECYFTGTRVDVRDLLIKGFAGDLKAKEEIDKIGRTTNIRSTRILSETAENFMYGVLHWKMLNGFVE